MKRVAYVVLPFPPSANAYWRTFRGQVKQSAQGRLYKALVERLLRARVPSLMTGPLNITMDIFRPAPTHANFAKSQARDLDNNNKVLLDALQGVLFENDSQVYRLETEHWDHEPENPRVQIIIEENSDERPHPASWPLEPSQHAALFTANREMADLRAKELAKAKEKRAARKAAKALEAPPPGSLLPPWPRKPKRLGRKRAAELATPAYRPPRP